MASRFRVVLLFLLGFILFHGFTIAESEGEIVRPIRTAPHRNLGSRVIDGSGKEVGLNGATGKFQEMDERMAGRSRVSVLTVAWLTLAMAVATGLGAVPFFFVELEPQWAGVCNGLAAGVMLAASFDLVQEGQMYGSGIWVVFGILSGGIFILLCKKPSVSRLHLDIIIYHVEYNRGKIYKDTFFLLGPASAYLKQLLVLCK